jgi:peptidoglycan/xylan/chitin deacetylase (PgdA/CDA1 family)
MIIGIALALIGMLALCHTAPFPFLLDAASGKLTVWRMPQSPGEKVVYLTFDDGPNPTATPALLDVLKENNIHATFFLIDKHVNEETAPIVRRMFAEGHAVAQHTGDRWLMLKTADELADTLRAAADHVESLTGRRPCPLFRPHAGWRSVSMLRGVSRLKYRLVGWSWMTWDWYWFRKRTPERVASQVIAHAAPGKIIVIHDGHHVDPRADRRYAIGAARQIIDGLRARGYKFDTLCQISDCGFRIAD